MPSETPPVNVKKASILLRMGLYTVDSGLIGSAMALVSRLGQMERSMRVSGGIIKLMDVVCSITLMGIYLTVSGEMIRLMGTVLTLM